ncbi:MAG: hypothetical protein COT81_04955 [Candidatus Buchananbacteria bacterium CG10_big_fil_rev_8_21_14_0_10_42_9]|uniref:Zinc finger DksA/TraR C4-type domain-containing protein n=1 Tax=Candidatus Buchananbacteria bacterium CG10_big_fil_rev_8_21_14_0_10_42_9 TaxID=1974526 RepID=A0A2H0W068_9BACT|nr:MAG: hypothetical protein COT81_04955 [Candidatus Buchananbacteria bacterium CG10_big_fil_rev_8_21_14_0_10_42_9]
MDSKTLEQIKGSLEAEKTRLEEMLKGFTTKDENIKGNYNANWNEYGDKEDENAAEVADYSDALSLEQNLEKTLADVKKALDKIDKGEYGVCHFCGQQIDERRLKARPTSSSCVNCKKQFKGEK